MPTLLAALTLAALLKVAHVEMPRWHLAFWYAVLVSLASMVPRASWRPGFILSCWTAPTTGHSASCTG